MEHPAKRHAIGATEAQARRAEISVSMALRTSLSENTRIAYRMGWDRFAAYCAERETNPLAATPDDVADFLVRMASEPRSPRATTKQGKPLSLATIRIFVSAINRNFKERNLESPARHPQVTAVLQGLGRLADEPPRQVKALREHEVAAMLKFCDETATRTKYRAIALRDAAVIAIGFAGALRRSEICSLRSSDIEFAGAIEPNGMLLRIRRSKTDQLGRGERIAIPAGLLIRPVERMQRWLKASGIAGGPVFRTMRRGGKVQERALSPSDVPRLVKQYAEAIGLDPADYSGHSLRAGFVTSAAVHHARLDKIMEVTRHSSPGMVLRYIRQAGVFEDHAGEACL